MIKQVKKSKLKKVLALYLAMMILLQSIQPTMIYALTGGPTQPEFQSFTPIGTSDMVDLSSGDLNYNIPIMDVGGYPINLAYNSSVTMDQEASWVGMGWDLNVGQISRQLRGLPDDFNGDEMTYENSMKENVTIGGGVNLFAAVFGVGEEAKGQVTVGVGLKYNNYEGYSASLSGGITYQLSDNISVGMSGESSTTEGVSVSPNVNFSKGIKTKSMGDYSLGLNAGVTYNSRKGVESATMGFSAKKNNDFKKVSDQKSAALGGISTGSISFMNDATFTPSKRVGMESKQYTFNLNVQGELWGVEVGSKFFGYKSSQGIRESEKFKKEKAYGFENSFNAQPTDVLDFNREKDGTFSKNTTSLPITNHTYDLYSIQGQGLSGMFRPYKSQVGYVFDSETKDVSSGFTAGIEAGIGGGVKIGGNYAAPKGESSTSLWQQSNGALARFKTKTRNNIDYEKVFFKNIGGFHTDKDLALFNDDLGGYDPINLPIESKGFDIKTMSKYSKNSRVLESDRAIARKSRLSRNQVIEKLTKAEAKKYGYSKKFSAYAKDHHTAEIRVTKEGGDRYIYGLAAYNVVKKETTFDVGTNPGVVNGQVRYNPGVDNSAKNTQGGDSYFNRITTPAYAHTHLLTAVLSADYQDLTGDGPSDDDLGTYTQFEYENKTANQLYRWRIPFGQNSANFDEGLRSSTKDNKGNYIYGEKEIHYLKKIVTKTHIAIFDISEDREDGFGVKGENGGLDESIKSSKLNSISLYSKPEYLANAEKAVPIKVAVFKYDYSLCIGIDNKKVNSAGAGGKLTLKSVYFTYKNSKLGEYTPYVFTYGNNPKYDIKSYDVWGNYSEQLPTNSKTFSPLSNAEYPFVGQKPAQRSKVDLNASSWLLNKIKLPSGGVMEMAYESDDYGKVQNQDAMQMFKVVGSGPQANVGVSTTAFSDISKSTHIYVELDSPITNPNPTIFKTNEQLFVEQYLKTVGDVSNPLYFRFLLNMANPATNGAENKYDYVTGYLKLTKTASSYTYVATNDGRYLVAIPVQKVDIGDGSTYGNPEVNPIQKTGWNFGRKYLNRLVYSDDSEENTEDIKGVIKQIIKLLPDLKDVFFGPNKPLKDNGIASRFVVGKSWVRLMNPIGCKVGGGSRVKQIRILDQWDVMTGNPTNTDYQQFYGQQYSYKTVDAKGVPTGKSSGVATYEPMGCKENPFVKPFYEHNKPMLLLGPDNDNYVEEPFGESFFPSPKITYSRVAVRNLPRVGTGSNPVAVKKHATGTVVTEFYTSSDFPTLVDRTVLSRGHHSTNVLASLLSINVKQHFAFSQGFVIHTNDMDGKVKSERVYDESQTMISGVDYKYSTTNSNTSSANQGALNNTITTIDETGAIADRLVGVDYDVINDFRENKNSNVTKGINGNVATIPLVFIPLVVPLPIPSYSSHESLIRTAVTTKVIHSSGILKEKIAYDLGSVVSTRNLAWDAQTGEVLLTETVNEYSDNYFTFNMPAYWGYKGMSQASRNIGLEAPILKVSDNVFSFATGIKVSDYLIDGDEVFYTGTQKTADNRVLKDGLKAWVVKVADNSFQLIDSDGLLLVKGAEYTPGTIKVIRSGHRNMQTQTMSSITMMRNPLFNYNEATNKPLGNMKTNLDINKTSTNAINRILNASAIEYSNIWPGQCECNLPRMVFVGGVLKFGYESAVAGEDRDDLVKRSYNPYLYNILGTWKANKSYAYLTGRNHTEDPTPRKTGFFTDYTPFYVQSAGKWIKTSGVDFAKWTFASEVTQYNPFGQELENRDALNRYSAALFGYNNRFPVAVASNTKYTELASDGFEDYDSIKCARASHFDFKELLKLNEVSVSRQESHSGRKSLRVEPNKKVVLKKQIKSCP